MRYRDPAGRSRAKTFDRKVDADRHLVEVESSKLTGSYVSPGRARITVGELATTWLAGKVDIKPSTRERYAGIIREHITPAWGTVRVADLTHSAVQAWIGDLDKVLAPASVRKVHRVLSLILASAVRDNRIARNVAVGVSLPRVASSEKRYLTHQQVDELARNVVREYQLPVLVLAYTGIRFGELAALKVGRVDLARSRIVIAEAATPVRGKMTVGTTKGHERREVPVVPFLVDRLTEHLKGRSERGLVFTNTLGQMLRPQTFARAIAPAAVGMGLCDWEPDPDRSGERRPVRVLHPHELRHTAASLAIASGADVKVVQQMLGHKTATLTLDLYGHLLPDRLDEVAAAMDAARSAALSSS